MTRPSFPTPQHGGDSSAIRVDGAIDGQSLVGSPDPAAVADPYPRYARLHAVRAGVETLEELRRVLASADGMIKNDVNVTLEKLRRTIATADGLLRNDVNKTLDELRGAIATANTVLQNTDATLLGKDAPFPQELREALLEVTRAARSLSALTDYLERHPESLIRGKEKR